MRWNLAFLLTCWNASKKEATRVTRVAELRATRVTRVAELPEKSPRKNPFECR